jgi:hypothetical protein
VLQAYSFFLNQQPESHTPKPTIGVFDTCGGAEGIAVRVRVVAKQLSDEKTLEKKLT